MAIRLVCPTCAAPLSVSDEHAGRPVKCPNCGGVVPPPAPPATEPPPALDALDDMARSAAAPGEPPIVEPVPEDHPRPRPVARPAGPRASGDDDRGPRGRDPDEVEDPRDRARGKPGGARRPRAPEDEPGDRPGRPRAGEGGGSNAAIIIAVIGFFMLACCGAVGFGVYWVYQRAKEAAEEVKKAMETWNPQVTIANYEQLQVGTTTRADAERRLGQGRVATVDDVAKAFPGNADPDRAALWQQKASEGRAVVWQNGEDYLLAAFHPNVEAEARLMLKAWRPKNGAADQKGEPDDARFVKEYPPGKPKDKDRPKGLEDDPPPGTTFVAVDAIELAQDYKTDPATANLRYKDKWLEVRGTVEDITPGTAADSPIAKLEGVPARNGKLLVWCFSRSDQASKLLNLTRGQSVTIRGKCVGNLAGTHVGLLHCRIASSGPDPAVAVTAQALIGEFGTNAAAAEKKYAKKEVFVKRAVFVSASGSTAVFQSHVDASPITIQADFTFDQNKKIADLKPGDEVQFKAECGGLFDKKIACYRAYLVP